MNDLPPESIALLSWIEMLIRPVMPKMLRGAVHELSPFWLSRWPSDVERPTSSQVLELLATMIDDPARLRYWLSEEATVAALVVIEDGLNVLDHWLRTRPASDPEIAEFHRRLLDVPTAGFVLVQGVALLGVAESGGREA